MPADAEPLLGRDGVRLYSAIEGPGSRGVVLYVVGPELTSSPLYPQLTAALHAAGFATAVVHGRGTGYSDGLRGDITGYGAYLTDFHSYLERLTRRDPGRVFVLGHSFGGALALELSGSRLCMQDLRLRRRTPQGARTLAAPARHARQLATLAMARALRCRAALFIATGQDVADVAESHAGIVYTQLLSPWQAQSCTGTGSLRTSSMGETAVDHRLPSGDRDSSWHITCVLDGVHSREALMRKILVVCYSRQGTTLRLAQEIAAALNADFERIEEVWQRKGVFGFVLSSLEAMAKGLPSIRTRKDPSNYDLVVLGTPTWAQSISAPMRAYLFLHRDQLRSTAFFATMGGFGAENALHEMKLLCDANDAPTCSFVEREVKANQYQSKLQQFVAAVRLASASGSARSTAAA